MRRGWCLAAVLRCACAVVNDAPERRYGYFRMKVQEPIAMHVQNADSENKKVILLLCCPCSVRHFLETPQVFLNAEHTKSAEKKQGLRVAGGFRCGRLSGIGMRC